MKKGILIGGIASVVAVVGIVAAIVLGGGAKKKTKEYRVIAVNEVFGTTTITSSDKTSGAAYVNQHLYSGDDANVADDAHLTLLVDSDKYIYAEEGTHFWIEASGKAGSGKSTIHVEDGDTLHYLKEALGKDETYEVSTPAATMAVRGTVFRVKVYPEGGYIYSYLEVFQGSVEVKLKTTTGEYNGVSRTFKAGECAAMRADDSISEFLYPTAPSETVEIPYREIPQCTAKHLGTVCDQNEELSITKELLFDYVALTEHQWELQVITEPTCENAGLGKSVCTVCGDEQEEEELPTLEHRIEWTVTKEATCTKNGERTGTCSICGVTEMETIEKSGHDYSEWVETKAVTCEKDGSREHVCNNCGKKETEKVTKLGHSYSDWTTVTEATCLAAGQKMRTCATCGKEDKDTIAKLEHSYGAWTVTRVSTCTVEGFRKRTCDKCGDEDVETLPKAAHDFSVPGYYVQGGCVTDEGNFMNCANCSESTFVLVSHATGHQYYSWHNSAASPVAGSTEIICYRSCSNGYFDCTLVVTPDETILPAGTQVGDRCPVCGDLIVY